MRAFRLRLYRERRRAAIVLALLLAAGLVNFWTLPGQVLGVPRWIAAPALFAAALGTLFLVWGLILPSRRHDSEAAALAILLTALLARFATGESLFAEGTRVEAFLATAALIWLLASAYSDRWLDALLPRWPAAITARAVSALPPDRLWPALARTPETAHLDPDPNDQRIEWIEPGRRLRIVGAVAGYGTFDEEHVIEAAEPGRLYSFRYRLIAGPDGAQATAGAQIRRLQPLGTGTELWTERMTEDLSPRGWLFAWIDDGFGRTDDSRIARIEATART